MNHFHVKMDFGKELGQWRELGDAKMDTWGKKKK